MANWRNPNDDPASEPIVVQAMAVYGFDLTQTRLSDMSIDDDIALALKLLRKAQSIYTSKK